MPRLELRDRYVLWTLPCLRLLCTINQHKPSCARNQTNHKHLAADLSRIVSAWSQTATHSQPPQTPCDRFHAHCAGTGTGTAASFPQACCSGSCADEKPRPPRATARVQSGGLMHESRSTGSRRSRQRRFQSDAGAASLCWDTCTTFLYHFCIIFVLKCKSRKHNKNQKNYKKQKTQNRFKKAQNRTLNINRKSDLQPHNRHADHTPKVRVLCVLFSFSTAHGHDALVLRALLRQRLHRLPPVAPRFSKRHALHGVPLGAAGHAQKL